jgi:hypothetical protein
MFKYYKNALLFCLLFYLGCNNKNNRQTENIGLPTANLVGGIEDKGTTMLFSEIFEDITFIPLEATSESLLDRNCSFFFSDKYIVVKDGHYQLFLFNIKGKFIRKISCRGQGPGEYLNS